MPSASDLQKFPITHWPELVTPWLKTLGIIP